MPARVLTTPLSSAEPQQVTIALGTSANETAGVLRIVIPNNTTTAQLRGALSIALDAARRDPHVFNGL
jgi:hypothetical protein